jgi:hypothetical protein
MLTLKIKLLCIFTDNIYNLKTATSYGLNMLSVAT